MALTAVKPRSWLFDLFGDYVEHSDRELWTGHIIALAAEFDLTERAIRSALLRLQRDGWLGARRAGTRSHYGLTDAGRELIDRGRERIMRGPEREWDGRWVMLTYTIPEARRELRDRLRGELSWLGFGGLGSGVFVSPHDRQDELAAIARRHGLDHQMTVFRAEHVWPGDDRALAARCWDLQDLNARYADFINTFQPFCEVAGLSDRECLLARFRLIGGYRRFPFLDPGLPDDLLPRDWLGLEAAALFRDLHQRLAPGANRYFDRVTQKST
ncbi:MAG TPA: PaaX family transcriptional regulator C-terminal domain-containing protein [Chloroflexota bacterium]|nr:PaaX family transcriptional regulator C-terminal domain-containing protein [Chloroflexota bacterium]